MIKSSIKLLFILVLLGGLIINCGDNSETTESLEIGSPPSLNEGLKEQVVQLSESESDQLQLEMFQVTDEPFFMEITAPGAIEASHTLYELISSPVNGIVSEIYEHEGDEVEKGSKLLELESLDYATLVGDFMEAISELKFAKAQANRVETLSKEKISSEQELQRAKTNLVRAEARLSSLKARLSALGISDKMVQGWEKEPNSIPAKFIIYSPIDGKINNHLIDLGEPVKAYQTMLDLINLDEVLLRGYPSSSDHELVNPGDSVFVFRNVTQSMQSKWVASHIVDTKNPALDDNNKSVVTTSTFANEGYRIMPGEQVKVLYKVAAPDGLIRIPTSSLSYDGDQPGVFVQLSAQALELRPIEIYRITGDWIIVSNGLETGEKVVTNQIFSLKAMLRFEKFAD